MVTHLKQRHPDWLDEVSKYNRTGSHWLPAPRIRKELGTAQISLFRHGISEVPRKLLLVAVIAFLSAGWGCTSQRAIDSAHYRGAQAGYQNGRSAGDAAGYDAASKIAEKAAYTGTVSQLYASGNYHRIRFYSFVALGGAFLLGFGLQYAVLYLLRRRELLYDIDRIILRKHATEVNLTNLLELQTHKDAIQKLPDISSSSSADE